MQGIRKKTVFSLLATTTAWLAGCGDTPEPAALPALLPPPADARDCGDGGYLRTKFYGELAGPIDWSGGDFDCEGMPRPEGAGARLRFAGPVGDLSIAIIVAMPELERGAAARELGSNVTVIEEGGGRFFSTAGLGNCWTDVHEQRPAHAGTDGYFVTGTLYCIAPLAEVNGDSSITVREIEFGGYLDWGSK